MEILRGESEHLSGAIAIPVLIGQGTISASILTGRHHDRLQASAAVVAAVAFTLVVVLILKRIHGTVRPRNEALIQRFIEIMGRIVALVVGTIAIEIIMKGMLAWSTKF